MHGCSVNTYREHQSKLESSNGLLELRYLIAADRCQRCSHQVTENNNNNLCFSAHFYTHHISQEQWRR